MSADVSYLDSYQLNTHCSCPAYWISTSFVASRSFLMADSPVRASDSSTSSSAL